MSTEEPTWEKFYAFYGIDLVPAGGQLKGDCPFCDKSKHLFVNPKSGLWDCKHCGRDGNANNFIGELHTLMGEHNRPSDLTQLLKLRKGVTAEALQEFHIVWDDITEAYYLPYYYLASDTSFSRDTWGTRQGKKAPFKERPWLASLGKFVFTKEGKCRIYHPCNVNNEFPLVPLIHKASDPQDTACFVLEKQSDALALFSLFQRTVGGSNCPTLFGKPGTTTFKKEWISFFAKQDVVLCDDNDKAGIEGLTKTADAIKNVVNNLEFIKWPDGLKQGYDVRDLIIDGKLKDPADLETYIEPITNFEHHHIQPVHTSTSKEDMNDLIAHSSFEDLRGALSERLVLKERTLRAMPVVLSGALSTFLPGSPLWMFIVAQASSGKTTIIDGFGTDNEYAHVEDKFGPKTLVSGWRSGSEDASLLPKLQNKILFIKEFTTILGMADSVQKELFDLLRGVYDGHTRVSYGNGEVREYGMDGDPIHFTIIAGVTNEIYRINQASLGERFVRIEYLDNSESNIDITRAAIRGTSSPNLGPFVRRNVLGFFHTMANKHFPVVNGSRVVSGEKLPEINEHWENRIASLAEVVAHLRAKVSKDRDKQIEYRPVQEVGARLGVQFAKLARASVYTLGESEINERIYPYVAQCGVDTAARFPYEICRLLYRMQKENGCTRQTISGKLGISSTKTFNVLGDMRELGYIETGKVHNGTGAGGRQSDKWRLEESFCELWRDAFEGTRIF